MGNPVMKMRPFESFVKESWGPSTKIWSMDSLIIETKDKPRETLGILSASLSALVGEDFRVNPSITNDGIKPLESAFIWLIFTVVPV